MASLLKTLLNILVDLNNAVVWMVLILPLISNSTPLSRPLGAVPNVPITNNITVTLMFHNLVLWLGPSVCLSFCLLLLPFSGLLKWQNLLDGKFFFFFFFFFFFN